MSLDLLVGPTFDIFFLGFLTNTFQLLILLVFVILRLIVLLNFLLLNLALISVFLRDDSLILNLLWTSHVSLIPCYDDTELRWHLLLSPFLFLFSLLFFLLTNLLQLSFAKLLHLIMIRLNDRPVVIELLVSCQIACIVTTIVISHSKVFMFNYS